MRKGRKKGPEPGNGRLCDGGPQAGRQAPEAGLEKRYIKTLKIVGIFKEKGLLF